MNFQLVTFKTLLTSNASGVCTNRYNWPKKKK